MSSTNFRSILIFASCVVGTCYQLLVICACIIVFFFFPSGTSLRARTFVPDVGWGGHNSTVGLTLPEVWARSVECVTRGKPFKLFWPWAHSSQIPGFPQHPRGRVFLLVEGTRRRISLFLHRAPRFDPAAQQQSSPLAAAACNSLGVWLLLQ